MLALMVSGLLLAIVLTSYKQLRDMSNLLVKAKSFPGPLWRVSGTERQGTIAANLEKQSHGMLLFRLNEKLGRFGRFVVHRNNNKGPPTSCFLLLFL